MLFEETLFIEETFYKKGLSDGLSLSLPSSFNTMSLEEPKASSEYHSDSESVHVRTIRQCTIHNTHSSIAEESPMLNSQSIDAIITAAKTGYCYLCSLKTYNPTAAVRSSEEAASEQDQYIEATDSYDSIVHSSISLDTEPKAKQSVPATMDANTSQESMDALVLPLLKSSLQDSLLPVSVCLGFAREMHELTNQGLIVLSPRMRQVLDDQLQ